MKCLPFHFISFSFSPAASYPVRAGSGLPLTYPSWQPQPRLFWATAASAHPAPGPLQSPPLTRPAVWAPFPSSLSTASEQPFQCFPWQHLAPASLGPAAASRWRVPRWGRFGGRLKLHSLKQSEERTFTPMLVGLLLQVFPSVCMGSSSGRGASGHLQLDFTHCLSS